MVGHQHKVTCVRLFQDGHTVITGSADRSLKIWDISRTTYKQTVTLRHGSTSYCVDIGSDSTAVTGHFDGSLRFWDVRTGDRTMDITGTCLYKAIAAIIDESKLNRVLMRSPHIFHSSLTFIGMHESGITCVQFNPHDGTQVLTNGLDSCLKLIDVRTGSVIQTMRHPEFHTSQAWSSCALSPNGKDKRLFYFHPHFWHLLVLTFTNVSIM